MKSITLKLLLAVTSILSLYGSAYAQPYFYYTTNDETIDLNLVSGKYTVEYPSGLYDDEEYPGTKSLLGYYMITEADLPNIDIYGDNPIAHNVYETTDGLEMRVTSELILLFKDDVTTTERNDLISTYGLTHIRTTSSYELYTTTSNSLTASNNIYQTGKVIYCTPNFLAKTELASYTPTDPYYGKQYYLKNTGQLINDGHSGTSGADINVEPAWDITTGDSNVIVAVIDGGFEDHIDLPLSRQVRPKGCNISNHNGYFDPDDPIWRNGKVLEHGTACMGIIAASHNNIGIAGIAPKCKVMPIRVEIGGSATLTNHVDAVNMAIDSGAQVLNCSFGSKTRIKNIWPAYNIAIQNAIDKGLSIVYSTMNYANMANLNPGFVGYPANATDIIDGLLSVGATDRYGYRTNYSPVDVPIDICGVSSKAANWQIAGEAPDIWTLDIYKFWGANTWSDTPSSRNDATGTYLPAHGEMLPNYGPDSLEFSGRFSGTSAAAPQVAGVIALMKSVNSCLKPRSIKDILITTADKVGGYRYDWKGRSMHTGYGRLNAGNAVAIAQSMYSQNIDLYMKDHHSDYGASSTVGSGADNSPDIWVRRQPDGFTNRVHQNPLYHANSKAYVYVKVRNKSCTDHDSLSHKGQLALFWNRSATVNSWGTAWTQVAVKDLPDIPAGEDVILEFEWNTPTPTTPIAAGWDACLVARIQNISADPYINASPINNLAFFVGQNNNVTLKNLSIINTTSTRSYPGNYNNIFHGYGRYVDIGNPSTLSTDYDFTFSVPDINTGGYNVTDHAEVKIIFDNDMWELFSQAGAFATSGVTVLGDNMIAIQDPEVTFSNITFPASTTGSIYVGANFWGDVTTEYMDFQYRLTQTNTTTGEKEGVQNYLFTKDERNNSFTASCTPATGTINNGQSITYTATSIDETAIYNWYNPDGTIAYTGETFIASPTQNITYKLQVVGADGCIDYSDVPTTVKQQFISSLSPNPASETVTVAYEADGASTVSLEIVSISGGAPVSYTIEPYQSSTNINISTFDNGNYYISLRCDGDIVDTKSLLIQ